MHLFIACILPVQFTTIIGVADPKASWSQIRILPVEYVDPNITSVADPYNFDTDPDPGYEKLLRIRIQAKKMKFSTGTKKIFKS